MKTILTKKIDGYDIIIGFGSPGIEPIETGRKANGLLEKQPEVKACFEKAEELKKLWKARLDSIRIARQAFKKGDKKKHAEAMYNIEMRDEQIKVISEEMKELAKKREAKRVELWNENLVYFEPKPGEKIITEDEYLEIGKKLIDATANNCVLSIDGKEIIDCRGVKYIKKGEIVEIKSLGEKIDGPLVKDVTPEEFQRIKYRYMSIEDIEAEKQSKINIVIGGSIQKRNELEILGDVDALKKSQDWYKAEAKKIEDEYKIVIDNRSEDIKE